MSGDFEISPEFSFFAQGIVIAKTTGLGTKYTSFHNIRRIFEEIRISQEKAN